MRKIDKTKILSKNYEKLLRNFGEKEHPKYNSSNCKYYFDIKMSLLHCQKGLCAYTEEILCDPKFISIENWNNQKYNIQLTKPEKNSIQGDLEHFDESLKAKYAWKWDNLFIVTTHNNCRIKGKKPIRQILKPDSPNYNPYKYLEFTKDERRAVYIFNPNKKLSIQEQKEVQYMIDILGLNCIDYQRQKQIEEWIDRYKIGLPVNSYKYITAWEMRLKTLEEEDIL